MKQEISNVRLALVHDWLNQLGGAEDVLRELVAMVPRAPIYTSIYWRAGMPDYYRAWDIRISWMDRIPGIYRQHQPYLPLYPVAFSGIDLSGYDAVLSNKSGFCHGIRAGNAVHVCYCLTPTRYVWDFDSYAAHEALPTIARITIRPLIAMLRRWDYRAAQRVTHFVAISGEVQARIRRYYTRESVVIPPPVNTAAFAPEMSTDHEFSGLPAGYYLIVSRLVPYRRIDLAIKAFNQLGLPLVIAGDGRDRVRLQGLAGPTVRFLGHVPDEHLAALFAGCRAYVLPGVEDFGIAPVQAQAAGRPVVAYGAGGALDTVIDGETGVFFEKQTPEALAAALGAFDPEDVDPHACRANAERFSSELFAGRLSRFVQDVLNR